MKSRLYAEKLVRCLAAIQGVVDQARRGVSKHRNSVDRIKREKMPKTGSGDAITAKAKRCSVTKV